MGARGPKSATSLAVVRDEKTEIVRRPDPPEELTREQAEVWCSVVDCLEADYFTPDTFPLLAQYCRHVVRARHFAQLIDKMQQKGKPTAEEIKIFRDLARSEEEQTRAIASLSTKMRLSQQSTYDRMKIKARVEGDEPWND